MFTSRAEYRLSLRADNADRRLTVLGWTWKNGDASEGCIVRDRRRVDLVREKHSRFDNAMTALKTFAFTPNEWAKRGVEVIIKLFRRVFTLMLVSF